MIKKDYELEVAMDTRVLTAHVPKEIADKVDKMAEKLERSRGWIVKQALADWIAKEEEHHRLTLEGLADVEAGRVISHADMKAWSAKLGSRRKKSGR